MTVSAVADTKTKILKYDKDGNVIGYESQDVTDRKKTRSSDTTSTGGRKTTTPDPDSDDPAQHFEPGEVIVFNPPRGFTSKVGGMGFKVLETVAISELSVVVVRLKTPERMNVPDAIKTLRGRFGNILVDANHQFNPSAANTTIGSRARCAALTALS